MRSRLPWIIWTVSVAGLSAAFVISQDDTGRKADVEPVIVASVMFFVLGFATAGALIASRHRSNPVGWICMAVGVLYVFAATADSVVNSYTQSVREAGAVVRLLITIGESLWAVGLGLGATLLLLLFPDGKLPSRRWRPVAWAAMAIVILIPVSLILTPGRVQDYPIINPVGIPGARRVLEAVVGLSVSSLAIVVPLSIASLFFRYRSASSEQRQQLKWLLLTTGLVGVMLTASIAIEILGDRSNAAGEVSNFLSTAGLSFIPIGIGVAVLRHRLYDIDVILNRALVYTGLTAVLAATYIAIVFALQQVLSPLTEQSDLAIAASTLAVAALFRPLRDRLQGFIDRRFYRRKFDAQRTLDDFNSTLRDHVDLGELSSELEAVVRETMQPVHVSLWLRKAAS